MFNERVSENPFSHATSEAELRASKDMKLASMFFKASAEYIRGLPQR